MNTHTSAVNLAPACTHSYEYVIFLILRSSLTLILSFSSLLCWHQLVPFFSPSHTISIPLRCETSDLPAWPSWIIAISYLLTNFYLSPSLFSCQNCLVWWHHAIPFHWLPLTCVIKALWNAHVCPFALGYHDFSHSSALPTALDL